MTPEGPEESGAVVHLLKLCVGADSIEDLQAWQAAKAAERARNADPRPRHVTRMWPRRADELTGGGSLFWVIRGLIAVRQPIEALVPAPGADGITRCAIVLSPRLIRVVPRPHRPFQGWRYLPAADAPADLPPGMAEDGAPLPAELARALSALGVIGD